MESTQHLKPLFSLEYLKKSYCLSACTKEEKASLADTLHKLSQLTWAEIMQCGRHQLGCEIINTNAIKDEIPSLITEDVNLLAFRFDGMKSMVGWRLDRIFHIVWLDRNFTLYTH